MSQFFLDFCNWNWWWFGNDFWRENSYCCKMRLFWNTVTPSAMCHSRCHEKNPLETWSSRSKRSVINATWHLSHFRIKKKAKRITQKSTSFKTNNFHCKMRQSASYEWIPIRCESNREDTISTTGCPNKFWTDQKNFWNNFYWSNFH